MWCNNPKTLVYLALKAGRPPTHTHTANDQISAMATNVVKGALLVTALVWFAGDKLLVSGGFSGSRSSSGYTNCENLFNGAFLENFMDILPLVDLAFKYGAPAAHQTVYEYLDEMHQKCQENRNCRDVLIAIEFINKYLESVEKCDAKKVIKSLIVTVVPKIIAHFGTKGALNILLKTASHPLGYAADTAQIILEYFDYNLTGKIVGAGGNTLAGVLAGFSVGGPPGAVIGGAFGFGIWATGELLYYENAYHLELFLKYIVD